MRSIGDDRPTQRQLFIADAMRVQRVDHQLIECGGRRLLLVVGDGGPATMAQLYRPSALA
jgi:hypothetical protein